MNGTENLLQNTDVASYLSWEDEQYVPLINGCCIELRVSGR